MTRDEDVLRDLLSRSGRTFDSLDGAEVREGTTTTPRRQRAVRWRRASLALAGAGVVAAISLAVAAIVPDRRTAPVASPTKSNGAPTPATGTDHVPFRLRLVLSETRVPADGTPIHGYVLAINHTGHPIHIRDERCDAWVQAGLSGSHVRFEVMSLGVACPPGGQLPEGVTREPLTIVTSYDTCQQGKQPGTPDSPHCLGPNDSSIPPLPPGEYHVRVGVQNVSRTPALPRPMLVTLLPVDHRRGG